MNKKSSYSYNPAQDARIKISEEIGLHPLLLVHSQQLNASTLNTYATQQSNSKDCRTAAFIRDIKV
jgi:hypothetical protein